MQGIEHYFLVLKSVSMFLCCLGEEYNFVVVLVGEETSFDFPLARASGINRETEFSLLSE